MLSWLGLIDTFSHPRLRKSKSMPVNCSLSQWISFVELINVVIGKANYGCRQPCLKVGGNIFLPYKCIGHCGPCLSTIWFTEVMLYFPFLDSMEVVVCRTIKPSSYSVVCGQPFSKRDIKLIPSSRVFVPEVEPYLPISPCGIFLGELVFGP